jgi:hypothetical protein
VGTYYSWGAACVELEAGRERWRRTDLKRFYGMAALPDETGVVACFDGRAGLTLEAQTGQTVERHIGLRAIGASRFDRWTLKYGRRFELIGPTRERRRWNRESFALLAHAFSPDQCVVSESGSAVCARDVVSSRVLWTYLPRPGTHVIAIEYSTHLQHFVALEYAYTDEARADGPMVSLLHIDSSGRVAFQKAIREWPEAVFCENGAFVLNGLGELHDVRTGEVEHVFPDFPR